MHEASLVKALLKQVEDLMRKHSASGAQKVTVTVGEFSGVEPDLLQIAFDRLAPATTAKGARLCINRACLVGVCDQCKSEFPIEQFQFRCAGCGGDVRVTGGEELMLESVVMETES